MVGGSGDGGGGGDGGDGVGGIIGGVLLALVMQVSLVRSPMTLPFPSEQKTWVCTPSHRAVH